jgi:pimeloyl-ACP methyl ester carboxylesterase
MPGLPTLVTIPALGCDARLYAGLAESLGEIVRLRTIIPNRDTLAGCVAEVLAEAPERFIVLGTSFGGRVALETALAAPARISGLVVIGATPGPSPDIAAGLRRSQRLRVGECDAVVTEMAAMIAHLPGRLGTAACDAFIAMAHDIGAETMARQSDALAHRGDLRPRLATIACPALMIWGAQDRFVAAKDGLALAAAVPGARYVEIADCGHLPTLEAPDETSAIVRHWLADSRLI